MSFELFLTRHAVERARTRTIPADAIEAALTYGALRPIRGAKRGVDLSRWEGVEVVCGHDGRVITVYRNKNDRALRDRSRRACGE
jgi:hypothetical protein